MINSHLKNFQKAHPKIIAVIKTLNNLVPPAWELGHISFTIDKCKENNRTVFGFNDFFLINIDGMIFYCFENDL